MLAISTLETFLHSGEIFTYPKLSLISAWAQLSLIPAFTGREEPIS